MRIIQRRVPYSASGSERLYIHLQVSPPSLDAFWSRRRETSGRSKLCRDGRIDSPFIGLLLLLAVSLILPSVLLPRIPDPLPTAAIVLVSFAVRSSSAFLVGSRSSRVNVLEVILAGWSGNDRCVAFCRKNCALARSTTARWRESCEMFSTLLLVLFEDETSLLRHVEP